MKRYNLPKGHTLATSRRVRERLFTRRVRPWIYEYSRTHDRHGRSQADQTAATKASIAAPSGYYRADVRDVGAGSDRAGYQRVDVQRGSSKEKGRFIEIQYHLPLSERGKP